MLLDYEQRIKVGLSFATEVTLVTLSLTNALLASLLRLREKFSLVDMISTCFSKEDPYELLRKYSLIIKSWHAKNYPSFHRIPFMFYILIKQIIHMLIIAFNHRICLTFWCRLTGSYETNPCVEMWSRS